MPALYASRVCREAGPPLSFSLRLVDIAAAVPLAAPLIEIVASDFRFPPSSSLRIHFGCYPYFFCQRVTILDKELFPCSDFGGCHFRPSILDSGFVIGPDTLLRSDTLPYYARIPPPLLGFWRLPFPSMHSGFWICHGLGYPTLFGYPTLLRSDTLLYGSSRYHPIRPLPRSNAFRNSLLFGRILLSADTLRAGSSH